MGGNVLLAESELEGIIARAVEWKDRDDRSAFRLEDLVALLGEVMWHRSRRLDVLDTWAHEQSAVIARLAVERPQLWRAG